MANVFVCIIHSTGPHDLSWRSDLYKSTFRSWELYYSSISPLTAMLLVASSSNFTTMLSLTLLGISVSLPLVKMALDTPNPHSTVSSPISCSKVVTLPAEMVSIFSKLNTNYGRLRVLLIRRYWWKVHLWREVRW